MHIVRNVKIQEKLTQYSLLSYTRLLLFEYIFLPHQTVPAKDNMLSPLPDVGQGFLSPKYKPQDSYDNPSSNGTVVGTRIDTLASVVVSG